MKGIWLCGSAGAPNSGKDVIWRIHSCVVERSVSLIGNILKNESTVICEVQQHPVMEKATVGRAKRAPNEAACDSRTIRLVVTN